MKKYKRKHIEEEYICFLVYCKQIYNNSINTIAFFIRPDQLKSEEQILHDRGIKGNFIDFYHIKLLNESIYLSYCEILEDIQNFKYIGNKDIYMRYE